MKKKTLYIFALAISVCSILPVYAHININLNSWQKTKLMREYATNAKNDISEKPMVAEREGRLYGESLKGPLIISDKLKGQLSIENSIFDKDIYIFSSKLSRLSFKDSYIRGDIYVISASDDVVIEFDNTKLSNIYINTAVKIEQKDKSSVIKDVVISKDVAPYSDIAINASFNSLINNADRININLDGDIKYYSDNNNARISGNKSYELKSIDSYPDTFVYDLSHFSAKKGYDYITDGTSYQDMYNLIKLHQKTRVSKIAMVVKNVSDKNLSNFEETVIEKFLRFMPNNSYGIYSTIFSLNSDRYSLYNMYFMYDTSQDKDDQVKSVLNTIYNNIKHLEGREYVKAVNRALALRIVYDDSLSKYSMYDALINYSAVCEGYAKAGYELLSKKFGNDNNLIIVNDTHMWNMLKMNDKWYHIDFTYNDIGSYTNKEYSEEFLLLSDTQLRAKDDGRMWEYKIYPSAE